MVVEQDTLPSVVWVLIFFFPLQIIRVQIFGTYVSHHYLISFNSN
jgi:hypothetical protein